MALELSLPPNWHGAVLAAHLAVTSVMLGVIWFVQHVHYPLKNYVRVPDFVEYEHKHIDRTGHVVGPPMLAEAGLATLLIMDPSIHGQPGLAWAGMGLLLGIWVSTAALQVPQHARLSQGFDGRAHRRLVNTNWLRTVLWSGRAVVAVALVVGR